MEKITVQASITKNKHLVWDAYTNPEHIVKWNFADSSWHCPKAENDLSIGGKYFARMEAKDGSFGFDFEAFYTHIEEFNSFSYDFGGRACIVSLFEENNGTSIQVSFDPETENSIEIQQQGWQAILNNFKSYCESLK